MDGDGDKRMERLQVMVTDSELRALDDFRFETRMPSRAAAVRELLRRGLEAEGYFSKASGGEASTSFGVLNQKHS